MARSKSSSIVSSCGRSGRRWVYETATGIRTSGLRVVSSTIMITGRRIAMSKKPISNQWGASVPEALSGAYQRCNEGGSAILGFQTALAASTIEVYADGGVEYDREL